MANREKQDMTAELAEGKILPLVFKLTIPAVIAQLITFLYNIVDRMYVARIEGSGMDALAALGIVLPITLIMQAFANLVGLGGAPRAGIKLGEGKVDEANRIFHTAFCLLVLLGVVIGAAAFCFARQIVLLFGCPESAVEFAVSYLKIYACGTIFVMLAQGLNPFILTQGYSWLAMSSVLLGALINIALDPLLIFTFGMGTAGAAVATVISQCVSFLVLAVAFLRGRSIVHLRPKYISRSPRDYVQILAVGFPTIARQGMASLASALMNIQGAVYGDAAVAALTISNKIYLLVRNVIIGIGQGFQPVAGYNYGAGDRKRTRQAFIFATKLGTVICILAAAIIAAFAEPIIGWFRADDQVIAIGRLALLYVCAVMPFMAYSTFVNQLYQCLGFKVPATVLASLRQGICYLPLIFILPHFLGLQGVQMTQPGSDLLTFFICIPFQIVFFRKHLRDNA